MALDDAHEAVHTQHDRFADERWDAHDNRHGSEKDLSAERWKAHDDKHDAIAHNLAEYKVQSNEWRASLSDLRATFAPVSRIEAVEKQVDGVREELRTMIATEREERRDQQNLRQGSRQGMSQTVAYALAAVGLLATVLSIIAILGSLLR